MPCGSRHLDFLEYIATLFLGKDVQVFGTQLVEDAMHMRIKRREERSLAAAAAAVRGYRLKGGVACEAGRRRGATVTVKDDVAGDERWHVCM